MNHRWPHARIAVPTFRQIGRAVGIDWAAKGYGPAGGHATLDRRHMARAAAASNLRRHPDLAAQLYAGCERAPLGWELRA